MFQARLYQGLMLQYKGDRKKILQSGSPRRGFKEDLAEKGSSVGRSILA